MIFCATCVITIIMAVVIFACNNENDKVSGDGAGQCPYNRCPLGNGGGQGRRQRFVRNST